MRGRRPNADQDKGPSRSGHSAGIVAPLTEFRASAWEGGDRRISRGAAVACLAGSPAVPAER
jgi:hypothetical protein